MLKLITNYHTHTSFCDGQDSPATIAEVAFKNGIKILGFSGHSAYPFASDWHIPTRQLPDYSKEILRLKAEYNGKMDILLGFEAEYIRGITSPSIENYKNFSPDYIIGSVHFVGTEKGVFTVDDTAENVKNGIKTIFNGDGKKVVQEYFALQREMLSKGDFQIWGHPDVIRKRNGVLHFFNENDDWYIKELSETAKIAAKSGIIAEINTGGIARKAIDDVYPSKTFLTLLHENKVPITISSDAHNKENLTDSFERAIKSAKEVGYTEAVYINKKGQVLTQSL